jgi:hypothetical protein
MPYAFNIVGVSPVADFFLQQTEILHQSQFVGIEYIPSYHCTLDALVASVEAISAHHHWDTFEVVDVVVEYWMQNVNTIRHWKRRLYQAGEGSLIISRIAEFDALRTEFEFLLNGQAANR